MNNIDALRISQERDRICEWVCDRFRQLIQEDRHDDAICFADEWYEWMDPTITNKSKLFSMMSRNSKHSTWR